MRSSLLRLILLGLLPFGRSEVRPLEVVVTTRVLLAVLLKRGRVPGEARLAQVEGVFALLHGIEAGAGGRLERLVRREALLEVHPVLRCVPKGLLHAR